MHDCMGAFARTMVIMNVCTPHMCMCASCLRVCMCISVCAHPRRMLQYRAGANLLTPRSGTPLRTPTTKGVCTRRWDRQCAHAGGHDWGIPRTVASQTTCAAAGGAPARSDSAAVMLPRGCRNTAPISIRHWQRTELPPRVTCTHSRPWRSISA